MVVMGIQDRYKKKFKKRKEQQQTTGGAGGSGGPSSGTVTTTKDQYGNIIVTSGTTTTIKDGVLISKTVGGGDVTTSTNNTNSNQPTATTSREFQESLFSRQGKTTQRTAQGGLVVTDSNRPGYKTVITQYGNIVTVPQSASINAPLLAIETSPQAKQVNLRQRDRELARERKQLQKTDPFVERVDKLTERDRSFFQSEGFKRIDRVANRVTQPGAYLSGDYIPYEERGKLGKGAQLYVGGLMSWPIALGGAAISAGGKIAASVEGFSRKDTRKAVFEEYNRASYKNLETFDPRTPQGLSTYATAATFAFFPAAAKTVNAQATITTRQAQQINTLSNQKGQVSAAKIGYDVKVGKHNFKVQAVGKETAINLKSTGKGQTQSVRGGFKYKVGDSGQSIQSTRGVRVVNDGSSASYTRFQNIANKGGNKYVVTSGEIATKTSTITTDQGLSTYRTVSVSSTGPSKTTTTGKLPKTLNKQTGQKLKVNSIEGGISKEVIKVQGAKSTQTTTYAKTQGITGAKQTKGFFNSLKGQTYINKPPKSNFGSSSGGVTQTIGKTGGSSSLISGLRTGAKLAATNVYKSTILPTFKAGAASIATVGVLSTTKVKTEQKAKAAPKSRTSPKAKPISSIKSIQTPKVDQTTKLDQTPKSAYTPSLKSTQFTDQRIKLDQTPITRQTLIPAITPATPTPIRPTTGTPPPPIIAGPLLGGFGGGFSSYKRPKSTKQPKGLTPTTRSAFLGIRGKTPKINITSGLGPRFVNKKIKVGF